MSKFFITETQLLSMLEFMRQEDAGALMFDTDTVEETLLEFGPIMVSTEEFNKNKTH